MAFSELELNIFFDYLFIFLSVLGPGCYRAFSLVAVIGDYSIFAMCGLFIVMASLVVNVSNRP